MDAQTIILAGAEQQQLAQVAVRAAPLGSIVTISPPRRTLSQNAN